MNLCQLTSKPWLTPVKTAVLFSSEMSEIGLRCFKYCLITIMETISKKVCNFGCHFWTKAAISFSNGAGTQKYFSTKFYFIPLSKIFDLCKSISHLQHRLKKIGAYLSTRCTGPITILKHTLLCICELNLLAFIFGFFQNSSIVD